LNTPKLNLNQRKINEKKTFKRLGQSDASQIFKLDNILTIWLASGTRNVLEEVNRTPSVKRVVLTSSCAAIYGDNADLKNTPNGIFTEDIWNTSSSLEQQAYSYSKTLAEKEAWKINKKQTRWDLVTINPSLVVGPGINPHATSESFKLVKQFGDGSMKAGAPLLEILGTLLTELTYLSALLTI